MADFGAIESIGTKQVSGDYGYTTQQPRDENVKKPFMNSVFDGSINPNVNVGGAFLS